MAGGVVIVGGAIIGSFCAWFLRRHGYSGPITVVEKDPSYRYSSTALSAASIRTQFGTAINIQMSLFSASFFRAVTSHLGSDADIGFTENGYLILAGPDVVADRLRGVAMQRAEGADVVALTPDEVGRRFPYLDVSGVGIGTFGQSGEGWFDAWSLLSNVRRAARAADVTYAAAEATGFDLQGGRVTGVRLSTGQVLPCDWCVLAAGAASGRLASLMDIDLPVSPRKRTAFHFKAPVERKGFPMLFDSSGIWIRPEGEGFIGGIQPPPERDGDATGDFEPDHDLLEDPYWPSLAARIPAMENLRLERAWAGHYEVNALDHNGVVGPHHDLQNLVFATGFSGHGVMHSPPIGRGVAEWITSGAFRTLDLSPLGWARIRDHKPLHESVVY